MYLEQSAHLKQKQLQHLSLQQQQALEILQCTVFELEQLLAAELAINPMLEELPPETPKDEQSDVTNDDEMSLEIERDEWGDEVNIPDPERLRRDAEHPDFYSDRPAPGPTLAEQLESEILTSKCAPRTLELAEEIIGFIDDTGYLKTPLADIAMICDADIGELEESLKLIQSFDPPGIGARDLAECMRLQLIRSGKLTPLLDAVISTGLEDIEQNRIPQLASKLGVTLEELNYARAELRKLDPAPAAVNSRQPVQIPVELEIIRLEDGSYLVKTTREQQIRFGISKRYEDMLSDPTLSQEDRNYLKEKLTSAKELLRSLEHRKSTLLRLGETIAEHQKDFLDSGTEFLHSFTMKQAADILQLNESTISRAVDEKYIQTPHGVFPLKFFFSQGYTGSDGQDISANAVKKLLKKFIDEESPDAPLSDEKLAGLLNESGLAVARRTVAKYRESMKIPPASRRKQY